MCGFSVKESQTDAYSIVRQKLYFNVRLTKVKSSKILFGMWLIFLSMSKNLPKLILDAAESFLNMCLFDFANMRGVRMFFFTYHCGSATTKTNGMNCEFRQKFLCFLDRFFFSFDIFFWGTKSLF